MSREKGTQKTGGREKGTLNKQTAELRNFVSEIIFSNMDKIKSDFEELEPEKRLMLFEKLLNYVLPKPQPADFPIESGLQRVHYGNKSFIITANNNDVTRADIEETDLMKY